MSKQTKAFISKTFDGYGTRIQTYLATIYAADTIYEQKSWQNKTDKIWRKNVAKYANQIVNQSLITTALLLAVD